MTAATAPPRRYVRRSLVGGLAALALALAGCSSSPAADPMSSTTAAPLTTPDAVAAAFAASFAAEPRFNGDVAKAGALRLVKPTTFMNLSGRAVSALARFYGILPAEILVVP